MIVNVQSSKNTRESHACGAYWGSLFAKRRKHSHSAKKEKEKE